MRRGFLTSTRCLLLGLLVLVTVIIIHLARIGNDRTESESISFIDKYGSSHGIMSKFFSSDRDYGKANIDRKKAPLGMSRTEVKLKSAKTREESLVKNKVKEPMAKELVHSSQNMTKKVGFTVATKRAPPKHYITINFQGRLGNLLFQYASLFGIANKNYLIPVISENNELRRIFQITSQSTEKNPVHYARTFTEKIGCAFEPAALKLGSETNTKLSGYFQSFKYFKESEAALRGQFRFKDDLQKRAVSVFSELVAEKSNNKNGPITYIAVHVRRGDFVHSDHISKYGYVSASPEYLQKGMAMFRANYTNTVFVVASDDIPWCKENMKGSDIVFLNPGNTRDLDFAVMTQCNHMLMTVGSFGWWTAWLINGKTVYFTGYPRPGSQLAKQIVLEDYRPPHWIGLS